MLKNKPEFWDVFPYDIYNLDFCGTCFPNNQPPFSDTFKSLAKIIKKHSQQGHFPFLIFLTMKACSPETRKEAKDQLIQNIEDNRSDANFTAIINSLIPNTNSFVKNNFVDFVIVSIPKIVCDIAQRESRSISVQYRAKYSRNKGHYYITKFVFRFDGRISGLRIRSQQYISNVRDIMRMDNVLTIDQRSITNAIRSSHRQLLEYKEKINEETAKY